MGRTRRVTLTEAAQVLGISKEAVRKRVSRGTLPSDVGEDGRRYVYLDDVGDDGPPGGLHGETWPPGGGDRHDSRDELISMLREQLESEREANRENRRIIAALASRIPEIEPPRGEPGSAEDAAEGTQTTEARSAPEEPQEPTSRPQEQRSWWRRVFGG
jgi:hypothetical protein